MTAPDLLACPFCGGEAAYDFHAKGQPEAWENDCDHWVYCRADDCFANVGLCESKAEAIDAWNRRATPAAMDVPFTTCDTHVAVIGTGQHSFVAEPVFTVSDALDVPKVKALVEAAKPFADIGVGSDPDYQAVVRIDRDAVIALRDALDALREGGDT